MSHGSSARWIGVRIDLDPPFEPLLTGSLASWLQTEIESGALKRWFFLRHSDDGLHLRLRLQSAGVKTDSKLMDGFQKLQLASDVPFHFRFHPYDRETLAFGHTLESAYAELLHAATSRLAIELLSLPGSSALRVKRWLLTAAAAGTLIRRTVMYHGIMVEVVTRWAAFVSRVVEKLCTAADDSVTRATEQELRALSAGMARMETALLSNNSATQAAELLRRVGQRGERGQFVATHALHLFCNEMGLSLREEEILVNSLRDLWTAPCDQLTCEIEGYS